MKHHRSHLLLMWSSTFYLKGKISLLITLLKEPCSNNLNSVVLKFTEEEVSMLLRSFRMSHEKIFLRRYNYHWNPSVENLGIDFIHWTNESPILCARLCIRPTDTKVSTKTIILKFRTSKREKRYLINVIF